MFDPEVMEANIFFLLNVGRGYTFGDVMRMPVDRFAWHVNKLVETKKEERDAVEREQKKAMAKSRRRK